MSVFLSAFGWKVASKANAVMMICAVVFIIHPVRIVGRVVGRKRTRSREESAQDIFPRIGTG